MFRLIGGSVAATIGVFALVAALLFGGVYFAAFYSSTTADTRGKTAQRENTKANGAFRQAAYEEFFDLCASVQSSEDKVKNLQDELDNKPPADREWVLRQSVTALENTRAEAIRTYNSKATQFHREQFLDSDLPYRLSVAEEKTECAA